MCIFAYHFLDPAFEDQDDIPDDDDLEGGEGNDDSQVPDQSLPQVPPAPPPSQPPALRQQPPPPMRPQPDALPPISAHLSKLESVLASKTADGYLNDFKQSWGSRLPGPGAGVASVRPGGHMQREIRKRKADSISRSAAEVHSFACVEDLSQRAGDRLLTIATNVNGFFAYLLNLYETLRIT